MKQRCLHRLCTKIAVEARHLLKIFSHHMCSSSDWTSDKVVEESKRAGLMVYRDKRHITVIDGVYRARICLKGKHI